MAAKKVGTLAVDWIALGAKFPQVAKGDFNAFRARHEAIKASLVALSEKPPAINWDAYKKQVSKPGFVDSFQTKFSGVKVPFPEDTQSAIIAQQEKDIEGQVKEVLVEAKQEVVNLKAELSKLHAEKPYEDMTVDEYLADKPELQKQIADDIKNYRW